MQVEGKRVFNIVGDLLFCRSYVLRFCRSRCLFCYKIYLDSQNKLTTRVKTKTLLLLELANSLHLSRATPFKTLVATK